jgi:hypothetical protein
MTFSDYSASKSKTASLCTLALRGPRSADEVLAKDSVSSFPTRALPGRRAAFVRRAYSSLDSAKQRLLNYLAAAAHVYGSPIHSSAPPSL